MYRKLFKRILDFISSFFIIVGLLPVFLIVWFLIYFILGSPVLFSQKRPGKNDKLFNIYKFRTMINKKDSSGNLLPDNQRITHLGSILRMTSLDEIPQLFNILKGDMSLVGPRPLLTEYLSLYNDFQKQRHMVKPGITGWAQVNGRNALSWQQKFDYDVWYVENISFLLDLKILFLTLKKVFKSEGISSTTNVTMEKFTGNA